MSQKLPRTAMSIAEEALLLPRATGRPPVGSEQQYVDPGGVGHNELSGLQGGLFKERYHFTQSHHDKLAATIGATGFDAYRTVLYGTGLGLGTGTVPHGGIGAAKFALEGPNASIFGPHVQVTTALDDYPLFQMLYHSHGNISLSFDAYFDYSAGSFKSSDVGSNFAIYKIGDSLQLKYRSGVAPGTGFVWAQGPTLNASGQWLLPGGSAALPGLARITDPDTGIYWPAANELAVSVGGVEKMRLTATGLGIGTATPGGPLHVYTSAGEPDTIGGSIILNRYRLADSWRGAAVFSYFPSGLGQDVLAFGVSSSTTPLDIAKVQMTLAANGDLAIVRHLRCVEVASGNCNSLLVLVAPGQNITTGSDKLGASFIAPWAMTIVRCSAYAQVAPTGAAIIFDCNLNGTTIWSTQANRLTIAAGANSGNTRTFNTTTLAQGDRLTFDVDQRGSTIPGANVSLEISFIKQDLI